MTRINSDPMPDFYCLGYIPIYSVQCLVFPYSVKREHMHNASMIP